ncbi:hypothetical protein D3C78_1275170 [compost metagenome]
MIATRVLRSFFGAYSFISATTLGITPPMPRPARKRHRANSSGLRAKPLMTVKPLNRITQVMMVLRRPMRSDRGPKNSAPSIIPTSAQLPSRPASSALKPQSCISAGSTTP